jgi:hypothetical protein
VTLWHRLRLRQEGAGLESPVRRWWQRRRTAPDLQLLAQLSGLLLRQDMVERQGSKIVNALEQLQKAIDDLKTATTGALERSEAAAKAAEAAAKQAHDAALLQATEAIRGLSATLNGHRK